MQIWDYRVKIFLKFVKNILKIFLTINNISEIPRVKITIKNVFNIFI